MKPSSKTIPNHTSITQKGDNALKEQAFCSPLMIPRRRSAKKKGRNLKKLQTDIQIPAAIDNLGRRPSKSQSLPSNPLKAVHPRLCKTGRELCECSSSNPEPERGAETGTK
jgi:hypothetical protein